MSKSLNINVPQIVQTRDTLNAVPSGSTATPDENVKYVPQDLTEAQKAQARQNIGAAAEGETGGATINEFHYLRDTTTDPATYYIDADGYEPQEGDLMTIVWDWPFRTDENDPDAAFKNPATLKNNSTNPSIHIKNANANLTTYDEIDPEVNTRWTVRLVKENDVWYAYNISTLIPPDWNTVDSNLPSYIKNKPEIPSNNPLEINGYKYYTEIYVNGDTSFNDSGFALTPSYLIRNGKVVCNWNDLTDKNVNKYQKNTLIWDQDNQDLYNRQTFLLNNMNREITVVKPNFEYWAQTFPISNTYHLTGTKLTYILSGNMGSSYIRPHGFDMRIGVPPQNMTTYFLNNIFSSGKYWGSYYVGNLVFVDKDFATPSAEAICSTLEADFTDVVNCYVPKTRVAEFTSLMETLYPDLDISSITSKIVGYDYLTWIDDHTPRIVILPSLALTMTDANGNTIDGDFVAQNITITPAV